MARPRILGVGGAHIDRRGQMTEPFIPGASIPGTMREDVGGGAFNALRAAARRGVSGAILSLRGGDNAGDTVTKAIATARIEDLSAVFLDRATPSYTALLDKNGDVVAALADMELYEAAFAKQMRRTKVREQIATADAVLCDANIPATGLTKLAAISGQKPLFTIAISPAKAVRLKDILPSIQCAFMNLREARTLAGIDEEAPVMTIVERLRELGLASGVITQGERTACAFDRLALLSVMPPAPRRVRDVTGAGDSLAGVMMAAFMDGKPLGSALREGVAAALLAIESRSSAPEFSTTAFQEMLALVPEAVEMR